MTARRILVIDDEPDIGEFIRAVGQSCGYEVAVTSDAPSFKSAYDAHQPDLLVLDLTIPDVDGIELLTYLADRSSKSSILIVSGFGRSFLSVASRFGQLRGLKIVGTMGKPLRVAEVEAVLKKLAIAA